MISIISKGQKLLQRTKREIAEQALNVLGHTPEANYRRLAGVFHYIVNTEQQKMIADWISWRLSYGLPRGVSPGQEGRL